MNPTFSGTLALQIVPCVTLHPARPYIVIAGSEPILASPRQVNSRVETFFSSDSNWIALQFREAVKLLDSKPVLNLGSWYGWIHGVEVGCCVRDFLVCTGLLGFEGQILWHSGSQFRFRSCLIAEEKLLSLGVRCCDVLSGDCWELNQRIGKVYETTYSYLASYFR
ncbi:hypothetical protein Droror1_Dr00024643 [Drosera rotundifolia]